MPVRKFNWYKFTVFAAIAIAIFIGGWKCGSGGKQTVINRVKIDTVYQSTTIVDTHYVPEVRFVKTFQRSTIDTVIVEGEVRYFPKYIQDTSARYYSDTAKITYGSIVINDTVSDNMIKGRSLKLNQTIPTFKETITVAEDKRNIWYLGLTTTGSKQNYFYSIGGDVSLKLKSDRIYSAGINLTKDNQLLFQIGARFKIKL